MCRFIVNSLFFAIFFAATAAVFAQDYKVISVTDGGTIAGTVKWSGPVPRTAEFPITKDIQICDPDSKKTADLERLIVGSQGGVANTVVYLKNISAGKAMDLPEQRRHLDQKNCRYVPHILLVPQGGRVPMLLCIPFTWTAPPLSICPFLFPGACHREPCKLRGWSTCAAMEAMFG